MCEDHFISVYWGVGEPVVTVGGVREILAGREGGWKRRILKNRVCLWSLMEKKKYVHCLEERGLI